MCSMSGRKVDISYPLHDPMVIKIAEKHNKHPAQVSCPLEKPIKHWNVCAKNWPWWGSGI